MIAELKNTEDDLERYGVLNPHAEAESIFCHLLNCKRIKLYTEDITLEQSKLQNLYNFIERRTQGEPLQYILGETEFYGFEFKIKKGVFIPRPETEILVDTVLNNLQLTTYNLQLNILDLCTGCGNIAISLMKMLPYYKMFASDIQEMALRMGKENAHINGASDNIEFRCGDLFKPWDRGIFFDIIVCNPPYIKSEQLKSLPLDVKKEPEQALDGGEDGLSFYRRILKDAPSYLKEKGYIFFEIGPDITRGVKGLLCKDFFNIEVVKDYNQLDRVIVAQLVNDRSRHLPKSIAGRVAQQANNRSRHLPKSIAGRVAQRRNG